MQIPDSNLNRRNHVRSISKRPKRFRQKSFPMGASAPGLDLTKALSLAAELEDAEIVRKLKIRSRDAA